MSHSQVEKILAEAKAKAKFLRGPNARKRRVVEPMYDDEEEVTAAQVYTQWTTDNNQIFVPASRSKRKLPPGAYEICHNPNIGNYFERVTVKTTDLVRFPDSNSDKVIDEIRLFWESQSRFRRFKMPYKRGILLWGVPGGGKSCTVQFVMKDVIERKGIVVKFYNPELFLAGYRILREIQPDTPVVVIMEDVDSILEDWSESSVLSILDGAIDELENVVFLATTNYPEKPGERVINRPSRFDRRFKISMPSSEARRIYFEHLFKEHKLDVAKDIDQWVKDTAGMSISHLRELFVVVVILENDYEESVEILQEMSKSVCSTQDKHDGDSGLGFLGE